MRGYKVSLGEVEAALLACKGVEAAVALIFEDLTGVQRLVVRPTGYQHAGLPAHPSSVSVLGEASRYGSSRMIMTSVSSRRYSLA